MQLGLIDDMEKCKVFMARFHTQQAKRSPSWPYKGFTWLWGSATAVAGAVLSGAVLTGLLV